MKFIHMCLESLGGLKRRILAVGLDTAKCRVGNLMLITKLLVVKTNRGSGTEAQATCICGCSKVDLESFKFVGGYSGVEIFLNYHLHGLLV
jgi:hypothetical protein